MPIRRLAAGVGAFLLVVACTGGEVVPSTTPPTATTIGFAAVSTPPPVVEIDPGVDDAVADRLVTQLDGLKAEVEALRGLHFLDPPRIAVVTPEQLAARHGALLDTTYDRAGLDVDTQVLRLFGLLGQGQNLRSLLSDLSGEPVGALYDPAAHTLVVDGGTAELGPVERGVVVREMAQALTDQYHRVTARTAQLDRTGRFDESAALTALFESDASYVQLLYQQGLSEEERRRIAEAAAGVPTNLPPVLSEQLTLTAERGIGFVEELMRRGGTARVDAAYGNGLTTEGMLHPERMLAGERPRDLPDIEVGLDGYRVVDNGSLGELALRSLLTEAMSPDLLTQTADGWGADEAFTLEGDGGEIAWVYAFKADSEDDAVEVAQGFLDHAAGVLGLANPVAARGGVEYTGGPYMYVDREGDGLAVVIASSVEAGQELRDQAVIP